MKNLKSLLLAGILVFSTACNNNVPTDSPEETTTETSAPVTTTETEVTAETLAVPEKIPDEYKDVLSGKSDFLFRTEDSIEPVNIRNFNFMNADGGYLELYRYAPVDLDRNGDTELILQVIGAAGDLGGHLVLNREGNDVYGFRFDIRTFWDLKTDGTFAYSHTAGTEDGIAEITDFKKSEYRMKKLLTATGEAFDFDSFTWDNRQISEEEYNALLIEQDKKQNAEWFEFSSVSPIITEGTTHAPETSAVTPDSDGVLIIGGEGVEPAPEAPTPTVATEATAVPVPMGWKVNFSTDKSVYGYGEGIGFTIENFGDKAVDRCRIGLNKTDDIGRAWSFYLPISLKKGENTAIQSTSTSATTLSQRSLSRANIFSPASLIRVRIPTRNKSP